MNEAAQLAKPKTAPKRAVFLFQGDHSWCEQQREMLRSKLPTTGIWLSDNDSQVATMQSYREQLGKSASYAVLDCQQAIHADALAAVAGTIIAGGVLFLFAPPVTTPFLQHLISTSRSYGVMTIIRNDSDQSCLETALTMLPEGSKQPFQLNALQLTCVDTLVTNLKCCHVLMADRGRGKSTVLGYACRTYWHQYGSPILVTGPSPQSVATLLEHAQQGAQFIAWDQLLKQRQHFGQHLIVDEAAAIPMHILKQLVEHFDVWAIATTVDGYEGCGKGFAVRFMKWLEQRLDCTQLELKVPLRWAENDPLETWLRESLFLNSDIETGKDQSTKPQISALHASQLTQRQLAQTMSLLLEAHYQSSPNDLRLLLDDPQQHLLLAEAEHDIVGVIWYVDERPLDSALHQPIQAGQRRVPGAILPQALAFYLQLPEALQWHWWRVARIAVHSSRRHERIGSDLLDHLAQQANSEGIDSLGSSFGATPELLNFWLANGYQLVRQGRKLNMSSGYPSALVVRAITATSQQSLNQLASYQQQFDHWFKAQPCAMTNTTYQRAVMILAGFAHGNVPYHEGHFAWWVCAQQHSKPQVQLLWPPAYAPQTELAQLASELKYASAKTLLKQLRQDAGLFLHSIHPK